MQADEQVVVFPVRLDVSFTSGAEQFFERAGVGRVDDELSRIGAGLRDDRGRLAPDQLGPAGAEASITAERQPAGGSVGLTVASFHRLNRQPVAHASTADRDRTEERGRIRAQFELQSQPMGVRLQGLARFVLEISRHADTLIVDWYDGLAEAHVGRMTSH
ncbi:MAG: hypothetical protein ACLQGP_21995 [Isosphaeraceae bacterium]